MRFITALAAICVCAPAFAQTPDSAKTTPATDAPKPVKTIPIQGSAPPAKPVPTNPAPVKSAYEAAPLAERVAIQSDLVWTGELNSIADGAWGERSTNAVKAFQRRKGGKDTGTLTTEERAALTEEAKTRQAEVGWRMISDDNDTRLGIPAKLVPQRTKGKSGGHWQSAHGEIQIDVFRQPSPATIPAVLAVEKQNPGRKITYSVVKPDFFVISGTQGLKKFYTRAQAGNGEVRGFTLQYDQALANTMDPMIVAMSGAFAPFPSIAQASAAGAATKRKVEYATGVIVNSSGVIVTDREATDACELIVVTGLGNAERIADDKNAGLALLRVYGAKDLKPLEFGDAVKSDASVVGIPDPLVQGGSSEVRVATVRILPSGETNTLEPAIAQGFAGSAAIDADGGFVGVVVQKPQVVAGPPTGGVSSSIVPADTIRKFLSGQKVSSKTGRASIEFAKDSVVRVICVRK